MLKDLHDCYRVLDLEPGASAEQVKDSYRALVKVWHPDRHGSDPKLQLRAQEKLKQINLAYERIRKIEPPGQNRHTAPYASQRPKGESKSSAPSPPPNSNRSKESAPSPPPDSNRSGAKTTFEDVVVIGLIVTVTYIAITWAQRSEDEEGPQSVNPQPAVTIARPPVTDGRLQEASDTGADQRRKALASIAILGPSFASGGRVKVDLGGPGTFAFVTYVESVVKAYDDAWIPSSGVNSAITVEVSVTVLRSGDVLTARITGPSGVPALDQSVETALPQIRKLPPFPEGVTDERMSFTLRFNLKR